MNTTDNKENNIEIKTETLPAKKVSDSETHQLHVVIHPDINGFGRLFGGRLLEWIDEVAGATARRHCGKDATTVAIDNLYFKSGAYLNDIIVLIGKVTTWDIPLWKYAWIPTAKSRTAPDTPSTGLTSSW